MTRTFAPEPVTEWEDIQALAASGLGALAASCFLLLDVADAATARAWLAATRPTSAADINTARADGRIVTTALQLALSAPGLAALGLAPAVIDQFGPEFRQGLGSDDSRSRRLGDIGANDPANWEWGRGADVPHLLVMLYATPDTLDAHVAAVLLTLAPGFSLRKRESCAVQNGYEPFGFLDGISQPVVDWAGVREPGHDARYTHLLAAGELLLGYPNEYRCLTDRPLLDAVQAPQLPRARDDAARADLGRNGSYLVYRRLAQDVPLFWQTLAARAGGMTAAIELAEAMVGRGIDGQPIPALGTRAIPGAEPFDLNDFSFTGDMGGNICPVGAHIRRANPRNADLPSVPDGALDKLLVTLGLTGNARDDAISSTRFHRILRRGRRFGAMLSPVEAARPGAPDPQAGLHFIALQASLSRQFEFIQGAWVASAKFAGLSGESDPLLGNRCPFPGAMPTGGFTRPGPDGSIEKHALPQFVTVKAGGYFFLPGLRALAFISALQTG